ncbi:UDP-N-acetylmuramate--L-alanine ligase [cf. Phormidesmis sp. LEGE 11477]|uniref:UDP-N-acetylmuramate--L-alanine ligase n=1 Tax=cf. Phormidesmis sp. LEGE 11477 TaxID=1828680 RepID=UPI00187E4866|nr:UDP-N-acetylmuramate--L-alanine ligase [cf. Phormidesmis sp. LEGE 11477]MBE9060783.1 UDP-N-acetylmuramate--L-alanine ligase [cf. Phormidesmis sp. LEGE 11477]
MLNSVDFSGRPFHFIGIGGIGMSALAHVLASRKLHVSGSDLRLSHITDRLESQGAHIFNQQRAENLAFFTNEAKKLTEHKATKQRAVSTAQNKTTDQTTLMPQAVLNREMLPQVVCSTAISETNAEYSQALALGCPIFHRSDVLAALMNEKKGIAIAGTHGKTTTSSITGYLLLKGGVDPTIIIGGEVSTWCGNAYVGKSDYVVAEADESDGSLVKLSSQIGVITNIELDHPDHYTGLDQVVAIFEQFVSQCKTVVGSVDCPTVRDRIRPTISYSVEAETDADYKAINIVETANGMSADILERGENLGNLTIPLLGLHNLSNTLAAIAVARLLNVSFESIQNHLPNFEGARRRFEHRGFHNEILFIDDYAHHPSEIKATLTAAQVQRSEQLPSGHGRQIVAVFQPHRYSRATTLLDEFSTCFAGADRLLVTDIYSAGEANPTGITGQTVADAIARHLPNTEYHGTLENTKRVLMTSLRPGDIVIFLTAGNLNQIIPEVMAAYTPSLTPEAALTEAALT